MDALGDAQVRGELSEALRISGVVTFRHPADQCDLMRRAQPRRGVQERLLMLDRGQARHLHDQRRLVARQARIRREARRIDAVTERADFRAAQREAAQISRRHSPREG